MKVGVSKPHINKSQPYDGDGWTCWGGPTPENAQVGCGATPALAYAVWRARNYEPEGEIAWQADLQRLFNWATHDHQGRVRQ